MSAPGVERLLTVDEVAEILTVAPRFVRRAIDAQGLPAIHVGRYVRVAPSDLAAWIAANRTVTGVRP